MSLLCILQVTVENLRNGLNYSSLATGTQSQQSDTITNINLPRSLFERLNSTTVDVFFTFYESPVLFPLRGGSNGTIGTPVIGATVVGFQISGVEENVTAIFQLKNSVRNYSQIVCVLVYVGVNITPLDPV